jgi:hypothetical protein
VEVGEDETREGLESWVSGFGFMGMEMWVIDTLRLEAIFAELIVDFSFLRIGKNMVRLRHHLEVLLRLSRWPQIWGRVRCRVGRMGLDRSLVRYTLEPFPHDITNLDLLLLVRRIAIRMHLESKLAICLFQSRIVCVPLHSQQSIIVLFVHPR